MILYKKNQGGIMVVLTQRMFKALVVALIGLFTASGCIYLGVGAIGAVGGYMVSPDTIEGILHADFEQVWESAHKELARQQAQIVREDHTGGYVSANIGRADVMIQISPSESAKDWKLAVTARKNMFPKVKLAQNIYTNIHESLAK